jgi:hypothetical protein
VSLRPILADVALASAARGAGTVASGPVAAAGQATAVLLGVHCSAVTGSPTLDASLEESSDGSSWSAIPGSSITQLTAAGNRTATALVTKNYVRVTSAVGGTTPSATYAATLWVLPN